MAAKVKSEPDLMQVDPISYIGYIDEGGDEVVREIDVFVSPELSKTLYLMQFPLQYGEVPQANAARLRKNHGLIELEHAIPQNIGSEGNFYLSSRKQVSHTIPISTHMALGRLRDDGAMHLVPLNHITQMRPDFGHVDEADPNATQETSAEPEPAKKLEKKPLLFQRKESERAVLARKSSYAYKKTSEEGEEWMELTVCGPHSAEYADADLKVTAQNKFVSIASMDGKNFVKTLDYLPTTTDQTVTKEPGAQGDTTTLIKIVKQLVEMIKKGVPVPYSVIRPQFPPTVDDRDLLDSLSSCAVLVRGNFYIHSRLLQWDKPILGARNFILLLLHTFGFIQRIGLEKVYENTSVSSEWIELILKIVALRRPNGWVPRIRDNVEFYLEFSEQTQLHNQYWERQAKKYESKLKIYAKTIR